MSPGSPGSLAYDARVTDQEARPTGGSTPLRLLFVCTANICRSAYAELLTRHLLAGSRAVEVSSAGTHGFEAHPVDPALAAELHARGASAAGFASRPLTMDLVERADLVVTAAVRHRQFVLDERPDLFRRVFTLGQLVRVLDRVEVPDSTAALTDRLADGFEPARPEDDVPDPFGRGPQAAADTAVRIEHDLHRVLAGLSLTTPGARLG